MLKFSVQEKKAQISTKPGQNISRLSFLHHKLHEFSYPCHSLVSSFFSTHRPVPTRCVTNFYNEKKYNCQNDDILREIEKNIVR